MLREMLKNVTLILPDGYDLIAGLRLNNVYLYYVVIEATMLADIHSFKLVLNVPLRSMNRQYNLYRMVALPTHISNNTFVQFEIEKDYFGVDLLQRNYLTLTEMDIVKCTGKDIMICPANHAVYSTEIDSCALSLFQFSRTREMCRRRVTSRLPQTRLERYGSTMLYYLAKPQMVHLQCQLNQTREASSMLLEGSGFLLNAGCCSLILEGLQLFPSLQGEIQYTPQSPELFIPAIQRIVTSREEAVLRQISSLDGTKLEQLVTSISSHYMDADVNTLLHLHNSSQQVESKSNGITLGLIVASIVLILFILYYLTQAYIWNLVKKCVVNRVNTESESVQKSQYDISTPSQPNASNVNDEIWTAEPQARFSAYSMQTV
jgi:hypothetical protein